MSIISNLFMEFYLVKLFIEIFQYALHVLGARLGWHHILEGLKHFLLISLFMLIISNFLFSPFRPSSADWQGNIVSKFTHTSDRHSKQNGNQRLCWRPFPCLRQKKLSGLERSLVVSMGDLSLENNWSLINVRIWSFAFEASHLSLTSGCEGNQKQISVRRLLATLQRRLFLHNRKTKLINQQRHRLPFHGMGKFM